jgi:epoxyqueuosine reductase QueG
MDDTARSAEYRGLEALARELGFDLFGVADVTALRDGFVFEPGTRERFARAISLGKRLSDAVLEDIRDRPTALYLHHYRQANYFLDRGALLVADRIQKRGFASLPIAASQIVDWENQRAHVSHKHVGRAAGLGWWGRNNLLVNPDLGARFRMVTVLTDMPLEPDRPLERDCGPCRACVAACPAGAIKETREAFDHRACYETLRDFRKKGYTSQFICGICVRDCRGPKP